MNSINIQNKDYALIIKRKLRNRRSYIRIKPTGLIEVTAPLRVSLTAIKQFLLNNQDWIVDKVATESTKAELSKLTNNNSIQFIGKQYKIKLIDFQAPVTIKFVLNYCYIICPRNTDEASKQLALDEFYHQQATNIIPKIVIKHSELMQLFPTQIRIGIAKSKWGSCNAKNKLFFNRNLMKFSQEVITYVVIHELAHIKHKNHSANFWNCVAEYEPDYKNLIKRLRSKG